MTPPAPPILISLYFHLFIFEPSFLYNVCTKPPTGLYYKATASVLRQHLCLLPLHLYTGIYQERYSEPMPHATPSATACPPPQSVPHVGGGRPQPRHVNTSNRQVMRHSAQPLDNSCRRAVSPNHQNDIATHRSSSPSSYGSNGLEKCDVSNSPPSALNDRNQLNLTKISEGGDTRTTIMIKNIPNKMSDMDLTEYIGEVCPRKIDFLYLRMDFKNGMDISD